MWKRKVHSTVVKIAMKLGFLDKKKAGEAQQILDAHPEDTSEDLFVEHHLLTEEQAHEVAEKLKEEDPEKALEESLKRANQIQDDVTSTGQFAAVSLKKVSAK